jgi:PAS domain S-box-containing protein
MNMNPTDGDLLSPAGPTGPAILLAQITQALGDAFVSFDDCCRCTYLNENAERLLGGRAKDFLGRTCPELFPEAARCVHEMPPGQELTSFVCHARNLDAWYKCVCCSLQTGRHVYFRNITESKQIEAQLLKAQERSTLAQRAGGVGVFDWDIASNRVVWTEELEELYGLARGAFAGTYEAWAEHMTPQEQARIRELIQETLREGRRESIFEYQMCRADGETRWMAASTHVMYENGKAARMVGTCQDITERKQMEDKLRRNQQELRALAATLERRVLQRTAQLEEKTNGLRRLATTLANTERRERERLAAAIHDDLQQILVAARMRVQLARQDKTAAVSESLGKAVRLLDDALHVARSLTTELRPPVLYEDGLIAALQWLAGRAKEQFQLDIELDYCLDAEPRSIELRNILFESVRELLFNIRKHAGVDRARIELTRTDGDEIIVAVEDEGRGFDPARVEASGTGIGLLRVRERMLALGGQADIDSVPGHGTRVVLIVPEQDISLPRLEQVVFEKPAELQSTGVSGTVTSGLIRIIVADDHRMVREGLVMILESQPDMSVVGQADDGREAIELARQLKPDVIVMDVNMPNVNGVEATRTIRRELPETVIVGVSAYGECGTAESMKNAGAVAYLEKGGEPDELVLAVRQHVAERGRV